MTTQDEYRARRALLVAALRSGKYAQATKKLRDGDAFCCLGVACEVFQAQTGNGEWDPQHDFLIDEGEAYYKEANVLPTPVRKWFGFRTDIGVFDLATSPVAPRCQDSDNSACLSAQNDLGMPFDQIATIIEAEPRGLFTEGDYA